MNNSMKTPLIRLAKREGMDKRTVWAIRVGSILLALLLCIALDRKFEDLFYFE